MFDPLRGPLSSNSRRAVLAIWATALLIGAVWVLLDEEAAGQGQTTTASPAPTTTASPSAASPSPASPSASSPTPGLDDFESFLEGASASPFAEEEEESVGIPGLGAVDLLSHLDELTPGERWSCDGPGASDGDLYEWRCVDPSGAYSVDVTGSSSLAVLSVTAVARGVPDREAEGFFGHVMELCLQGGPASLSTEAWVSGNVPSGGSTISGDTAVSIYGTREARALEVNASEL